MLFVLIIIVSFSPIVIPEGVTEPWLFGMPRTLWMGIVISFLIAFLTLFAAMTIGDAKKKESDK